MLLFFLASTVGKLKKTGGSGGSEENAFAFSDLENSWAVLGGSRQFWAVLGTKWRFLAVLGSSWYKMAVLGSSRRFLDVPGRSRLF